MWRVFDITLSPEYYCKKTIAERNTDREEPVMLVFCWKPQASNHQTAAVVKGFIRLFTALQLQSHTGTTHAASLTNGFASLLHSSSHSFFSCGPSDKSSKERGMFDGLLDSRRPENTSPGETPTLSLICHPMQVWLFIMSKQKVAQHPDVLNTSVSSRSCGSAAVTRGSRRGRSSSAGTAREWTWSSANTGSPSARTAKVRWPLNQLEPFTPPILYLTKPFLTPPQLCNQGEAWASVRAPSAAHLLSQQYL